VQKLIFLQEFAKVFEQESWLAWMEWRALVAVRYVSKGGKFWNCQGRRRRRFVAPRPDASYATLSHLVKTSLLQIKQLCRAPSQESNGNSQEKRRGSAEQVIERGAPLTCPLCLSAVSKEWFEGGGRRVRCARNVSHILQQFTESRAECSKCTFSLRLWPKKV
jgi:hypothetical protein